MSSPAFVEPISQPAVIPNAAHSPDWTSSQATHPLHKAWGSCVIAVEDNILDQLHERGVGLWRPHCLWVRALLTSCQSNLLASRIVLGLLRTVSWSSTPEQPLGHL